MLLCSYKKIIIIIWILLYIYIYIYFFFFFTDRDIYCTRGLFILIFPFAQMLCKSYILYNLGTVHNVQSCDSPCYMAVVLSGI